ncbi:AAA family ATPase [uncultured Coprobacter sp.]|uniref:McrB family protein n=1 Tax=uncultured Coprobacter sp. TaxID=1720550 RepID=UPI0026060496|nr:AAA family ATPase [uncultured Coprobacter sp.]
MNVWKLGCRWGSGKPLFYNFLVARQVVVGWHGKKYKIGDWILLTDGHTVLAFAKILANPKPIIDYVLFEEDCRKSELPFNEDIDIYKAEITPLNECDRFLYQTQQGIIKIWNEDVLNKLETIKLKYMRKKEIRTLLESNKNMILHGAPGTGKTYLARHIYDGRAEYVIGFVQFHPSYDYTDFVEGLRPKEKDDQIGFERIDGVFKAFCKEAKNHPDTIYVFIIDEINRGDMSKIFGELFFSIDPGYRGEKGQIYTQYQNLVKDDDVFKKGFYVPDNVYIIGTMNDIDRSVESMDFAMRRRFAFMEITAQESQSMLTLEAFNDVSAKNADKAYTEVEDIKGKMNALNAEITSTAIGLSSDYQIGAAYFLKYALYADQEKEQAFNSLWNNHLKSILTEYLRGTGEESSKMERLKAAYDNGKAQNN